MAAAGQFAFGRFRSDLRTGQLWRDGGEVSLTPRAAAVLHTLAQQAQELVTRQELFERIWGGMAVTDDALTSCIQELRRALGDDARQPRYIETRHRRGYRLMIPAVPIVDRGGTVAALQVSASARTRGMARPLLAVFPLQALPDEECLNAMAARVTAEIAHGLWRGGICDVAELDRPASDEGGGAELTYAVRGSLLRLDDGLTLSLRCETGHRGAALWFGRFGPDRSGIGPLAGWPRSAIGAIQSAIQIAEMRRARQRNSDGDPEVHGLLLEAHALSGALEPGANRQALALLGKVLDAAPDEPRALALAAWCHAQRSVYNWSADAARDRRDGARFATSAIPLGADDPTCLTMIGTARSLIRDHTGAGPLLTRALQLNPYSSWIHSRLGWLATYLDQPDRAIHHFRTAMRLAPLDPAMFNSMMGLGSAHFVKGRFTPAIRWMERGLALNPRAIWAYRNLVPAYVAVGKQMEAERGVEAILSEHPSLSIAAACGAMVFSRPTTARLAEGLLRGGLPSG
jgi:DNA-binding winged helix-turn-helix (wHTH) protein/tetratricopeptide (TPR) repeat protein